MERKNKGKSIMVFPANYVIIDTETSGLSPDFDSIIEVSAIKFENEVEIERFTSLIKPDFVYEDGTYVDSFIEELTGITNDMLAVAPSTQDALSQYYNFLSDSILIGHNVNFDINFLYDKFNEYLNISLTNDYVDTMRIFRKLYPDEKHHRLQDLATKYCIDYSHSHRSMADCEITKLGFEGLKNDIIVTGGIELFIEKFKSSYKTNISDISSDRSDFDITHPLYGKVCVFTGTLEKMTRKEAMQLVADYGGINGNNITKQTNYLILGNNDYCPLIKGGKSNKHKKAEGLKLSGYDIDVIPENVFYDMISLL